MVSAGSGNATTCVECGNPIDFPGPGDAHLLAFHYGTPAYFAAHERGRARLFTELVNLDDERREGWQRIKERVESKLARRPQGLLAPKARHNADPRRKPRNDPKET